MRLIRHMYIDLLEIAFEKRLIRHMYIIFIGKLSSFPAKRRMHMHFALPRVAFAYTWSRKAQHSFVSRSDFECFPIEYYTCALVWLRSRRESNLGGGVSELSANLALLPMIDQTLLRNPIKLSCFDLLNLPSNRAFAFYFRNPGNPDCSGRCNLPKYSSFCLLLP